MRFIKNSEEKKFYLIIFAGWVAIIILGIFYFYNTTLWVYFWLFSAILLKGDTGHILKKRLSRNLFKVIFVCSVLISIVGFYFLFRLIKTDLFFTKGLSIYNSISYLTLSELSQGKNILFVDYDFLPNDFKKVNESLKYFEALLNEAPFEKSIIQRQYINALTLIGRLEKDPSLKERRYKKALNQAIINSNLLPSSPIDLLGVSTVLHRMYLDNFDKRNSFQTSIDYINKALIFDPTNPIIFDNLGLMYREEGMFFEAVESFKKAIFLKNDYIPSYIHLSEVLVSLNRKSEALGYYKKGLKVNPDNELIQVRIKELIN